MKSTKRRIGGQLVEYDDATQEIQLNRSHFDVLIANPGDAQNCMNSKCIMRNAKLFPHPVYAASTVKSRVYIVDKISDTGQFLHAVRYELSDKDSRLIADHDENRIGEPGMLTLRLPRDPKGSPKRAAARGCRFKDGAGHGRNPGTQYSGQRNRPVTSIGEAGRLKVAVGGLLKDGMLTYVEREAEE